jgi:hypothetical protein
MQNAHSEAQLNSYKKIINAQPLQLNNTLQGANSATQLQGSTYYNTLNHTSGKCFIEGLTLKGNLLGERSAYNFDGSATNFLKLIEINPNNQTINYNND